MNKSNIHPDLSPDFVSADSPLAALQAILSVFDCQSGSLHWLNPSNSLLELHAHIGIPEFLIPKISQIPLGKGIAGVAAETLQPVELCNLQEDGGGIAKPSAKLTQVQGSLAVPILINQKLYGTLGIGKSTPYSFTDHEKDLLSLYASSLYQHFPPQFN
jgi:putative methionine-R-sulfoxide reductase with GAF domain